MINLYDFITSRVSIDGHIHLFDEHAKLIQRPIQQCVGFLDVEPKYIDKFENCSKLYDKFIDKYYDDNMILLATGTQAQDIINIHKNHPDKIKGFGELKCYKYWSGKKLGLTLDTYKDVFDYNEQYHLPIYIHLTLFDQSDAEMLEKYICLYPHTPIVLCHCGMGNTKPEQRDDIYARVLRFIPYTNLWFDLTFDAQDYFYQYQHKLNNLPPDRLILGTDINPTLMEMHDVEKVDKIIKQNIYLAKYVNSTSNIKRLFNIK